MSVADVEAELRRRGRTPREPETSLADLRVEMLQGALSEAQQARVDQAEALIGELRARLAEKDARITQLEQQLAGYARSVADLLATTWPKPGPQRPELTGSAAMVAPGGQ